MPKFKNIKALQSALDKLQKAAAAGEPVGKQLGVDSRSWQQLIDKAQELDALRNLPLENPPPAFLPEQGGVPRGIMKSGPTGSEIVIPRQGGSPLAVSGSTPEEAMKAHSALFGSSEVQDKIVKENALKTIANKQDEINDYLKQKQLAQIPAEDATQKIDLKKVAGMGAMPSSTSLIKEPLQDLKDLYQSVRRPMLEKTQKAGEWIADTVRPRGLELSEDAKQQERDVAGGLAQMALDPANLLSPGFGAAAGAADLVMSEEENKKFNTLQNRWK